LDMSKLKHKILDDIANKLQEGVAIMLPTGYRVIALVALVFVYSSPSPL